MSAWSETWQVTPKTGRTWTSTAIPCVKNAASSASTGIRTPPPSRRSGFTPCSIAARRRPASSPSTGHVFHSSASSVSSATAFPTGPTIERLEGLSAIGHVRYSTTGATILRNVQPLFAELDGGGFAVAHNGNLTNGLTLRRNLIRDGAICQSTTDTEVIVHLVARSREGPRDRPLRRGDQADRGRLFPRRADQQEADRRPRSAGHPPAGAGRTRRPLHPRPPRPAPSTSSAPASCAISRTARRW